jgi:hypothetical protein
MITGFVTKLDKMTLNKQKGIPSHWGGSQAVSYNG